MIFDSIRYASQYTGAIEGIAAALRAAAAYTAEPFRTGRTELDGEKLFLIATSYETKPLDENSQMEAHRRYIDVMYMVEGEELIYVTPTQTLFAVTQPYDAAGDALLARMEGAQTAVRLRAGQFVVLFPQDAHCPGCRAEGCESVKKIICKVAV